MPGLIGFTDRRRVYTRIMLSKMRNLLKHFEYYIDDKLYSNDNIYASRSHLGIINQGKMPYICNNRFAGWLAGEFYNKEELKEKYKVEADTDNELLINIYNKTKSFNFLQDIDGRFASVFYDKEENKVNLITDRFGFKPLYWMILDGNLVWSSELKGFLGHKDFKPIIDRQAVVEFFNFGYLLENRSWFKNIELVPPASVLTFDIENSTVKIEHYWSWQQISQIKNSIREEELIEEFSYLFKKSVCTRIKDNEKIGLCLSGGLDSRAVLAFIPKNYKCLHTFTFGQKNCDDIKIARAVSNIRGTEHHILEINSNNWLMSRINSVWYIDGAIGLQHMHGTEKEYLHEYKTYVDFMLNGFAGDLIFGGSYLRKNNLDKKINSSIVKNITHSKLKINNFDKWYYIRKTDPYFINNRVRRFTNCGLIAISKAVEVRTPAWSNELINFIYSLPDFLRYKSYLYNKMLVSAFPKYFKDIPWQKTGSSIGSTRQFEILIKLKKLAEDKLRHELLRFGLSFKYLRDYTNYPAWIRQEPGRSFIKKILLRKNALYPAFINKETVVYYIERHMRGKANYHNEICLALTFELWLRQIFEGDYRK